MCVVGTVCNVFCTEIHYTLGYSTFTVVVVLQRSQDFSAILTGAPKGGLKSRFQAGFCTNHAQKLPEIYVHAKFTQSRWMPDWFFTQSRNYFPPIPVFTLWNMKAITLSPWEGPLYLPHTLITWHNMFISLGSSYNQKKADMWLWYFEGEKGNAISRFCPKRARKQRDLF